MSRELPSPPAGLAMVIKAAGDPDVAMHALSGLIDKEPSLTAALLTMANSAAYGVGRPVRTVQQCTLLLGTRCIRNIAVSHAVRVATAKVDAGAFELVQFWEDSLRRATAALVVARQAGFEDPSEAFTVGLVQDLGALATAVAHPESSAALQEATRLAGDERIAAERAAVGASHPEAFVRLARKWGLPDDMVAVVAHHHDAATTLPDRRAQRLLEICRTADAVADVVQTSGRGGAIARAKALLTALPSRTELDLEAVVEAVSAEFTTTSRELNIQTGAQPSFQDLMSSANEALMSINDSYEELTRKLEQLLAEKEELTRQLKASNEALRRLAATDMLTGVANRRAFTEMLGQALESLAATRRPLSLVMMDIDHFKKVNDTYGHAAGDDVLKAVCQRMARVIRPEDMIGRLGGEEFAVLLPRCPQPEARRVAERLRVALRTGPVRCRDGTEIAVAASFGGDTVNRLPTPSGDEILRRADEALYASKEGGRDRVTWAR